MAKRYRKYRKRAFARIITTGQVGGVFVMPNEQD
jgi:hypothetical protein